MSYVQSISAQESSSTTSISVMSSLVEYLKLHLYSLTTTPKHPIVTDMVWCKSAIFGKYNYSLTLMILIQIMGRFVERIQVGHTTASWHVTITVTQSIGFTRQVQVWQPIELRKHAYFNQIF